MKKYFSFLFFALVMVLATGVLTAAAPAPVVTIEVVGDGLPATMKVGESYTVVVNVTSNVPFNAVQAMPDLQYPGKGVVAQGGDHAGGGTTATVAVTFTAKTDTSKMPDGKDVLDLVVGVRYKGGVVVGQAFHYEVTVLP